jgi:Domain of unknown function (DUF1707)
METAMPQPHLRAADADRAAVATVLGQHMSAGRLTLDEFDERLTRAYAAKTFGELDALTADLPAVDGPRSPERHLPAQTPAPAAASTPANACGPGPMGHGDDIRSAWRSWLATALIVLTIWGATSLAAWEFHYFWPIWVIGPWGAVLLARTVTGGREERPDRRRELRS